MPLIRYGSIQSTVSLALPMSATPSHDKLGQLLWAPMALQPIRLDLLFHSSGLRQLPQHGSLTKVQTLATRPHPDTRRHRTNKPPPKTPAVQANYPPHFQANLHGTQLTLVTIACRSHRLYPPRTNANVPVRPCHCSDIAPSDCHFFTHHCAAMTSPPAKLT